MIVLVKLFHKNYAAIAIWPLILIRDKKYRLDKVLINHEKIHLKQQAELLWFAFFIWYITEFIIKLIYFRNRNKAYKNICFEREAYQNEMDLNYLKKRKLWSFWKYL